MYVFFWSQYPIIGPICHYFDAQDLVCVWSSHVCTRTCIRMYTGQQNNLHLQCSDNKSTSATRYTHTINSSWSNERVCYTLHALGLLARVQIRSAGWGLRLAGNSRCMVDVHRDTDEQHGPVVRLLYCTVASQGKPTTEINWCNSTVRF